MIEDFILHFSHNGKTPRRSIDRDAAHAVPPDEFHRAALESRTGGSSFPPAIAELQAAVLDCFHQAADFAFRLSRMTMGEKFYDRCLSLSRACRIAAAAVRGWEQDLADSRALRQLPPAPSWIGRPCTSATQALVVLAQDIAREVSQTALDLHAKATGKTLRGVPCGNGELKVIVKVQKHALDKEIARRFNTAFVFPDPRLLLVESRLELMGLALVDAAVSATATVGASGVAAADTPVCRLRIEGENVFLDGQAVGLDMGPETRGAALCMLGHLLAAAGQWVSGTELNERELKGPCREHDGARWDRARKALPETLLSLIESNHRKGYRLTL